MTAELRVVIGTASEHIVLDKMLVCQDSGCTCGNRDLVMEGPRGFLYVSGSLIQPSGVITCNSREDILGWCDFQSPASQCLDSAVLMWAHLSGPAHGF